MCTGEMVYQYLFRPSPGVIYWGGISISLWGISPDGKKTPMVRKRAWFHDFSHFFPQNYKLFNKEGSNTSILTTYCGIQREVILHSLLKILKVPIPHMEYVLKNVDVRIQFFSTVMSPTKTSSSEVIPPNKNVKWVHRC